MQSTSLFELPYVQLPYLSHNELAHGRRGAQRRHRIGLNMTMSDSSATVENAFTYLANLQLPHAHLLHPQACNPAMDLLALVSPGGTRAPTNGKGKNKDIGPDTRGWTDTKVSLWRMMSNQVWAVDVKGRPLGLAWSIDGELSFAFGP
jgi:hypothetical protein